MFTTRHRLSGNEKRLADPPMLPEYFTPAELAEQARVTRRTVYAWLLSGRLKGIKMGPKQWRITKEQFETFLRLCENERSAPKPEEKAAQVSLYDYPEVGPDPKGKVAATAPKKRTGRRS